MFFFPLYFWMTSDFLSLYVVLIEELKLIAFLFLLFQFTSSEINMVDDVLSSFCIDWKFIFQLIVLKRSSFHVLSIPDSAIQNVILEAPWFKTCKRLCAYISCKALREVDTSNILSEVLQSPAKGLSYASLSVLLFLSCRVIVKVQVLFFLSLSTLCCLGDFLDLWY